MIEELGVPDWDEDCELLDESVLETHHEIEVDTEALAVFDTDDDRDNVREVVAELVEEGDREGVLLTVGDTVAEGLAVVDREALVDAV